MTARERLEATERLNELERKGLLPAETLNDLRVWWRQVLRREQNKVVNFEEWQRNEMYRLR